MREAKRCLKATTIYLFRRDAVSSVDVALFGQDDFVEWCKTNGFELEMRSVDSGTTLSDGRGFDVRKQFLRSQLEVFASIRSDSPEKIALRNAGFLDSIQREFIRFCRAACASSWSHEVRLDGKSIGSFETWFESLPPKLKHD